ncbi:hypothetical protein VKT23_003458 [Stygiomarasmius scandens]|uniref:Uncharacterized protein n=1 Tax=Marasmiellus scandens TaxID=2682957 RepID=A0ABR1JX89_9AGAR
MNVADAAGFTPLRGAAQIVQDILTIVETMKKNQKDCLNIARRSFELVEGIHKITNGKKESEIDNELLKDIKKFER